MMQPYYTLVGFEHVYLEDSWVLDVVVAPRVVEITAEVMLTEEHPDYRVPPPGVHSCYRRGDVRFVGVQQVLWTHMMDVRTGIDPDGTIDYGNFDQFQVDGHRYVVAGDFGSLEIEAEACELTLDPA